MALVILDGNQSATTLSTIVVSSAHIPAHTVVSLGTQAKTDILSAVSSGIAISGTVTANAGNNFAETIGNGILEFTLNEGVMPISGTVTPNLGNVAATLFSGAGEPTDQAVRIAWCSDDTLRGAGLDAGGEPLPIQIYLGNSAGNRVTTANPLPISGSVTIGSALPAGTNRIGVVTIGGGTVTIGAGTSQIGSVTASISGTVPISISSVTVGNSVTIGSLPAISGTVTAQTDLDTSTGQPCIVLGYGTPAGMSRVNYNNPFPVQIQNVLGQISSGNPFPISGTVTIGAGTAQIGSVTASGTVTIGNDITLLGNLSSGLVESVLNGAGIPVYFRTSDGDAAGGNFPISGTVTANTFAVQGTTVTTSNFTSTTPSTVLAGFNATREVLTIFNEGGGNLHICAGATCTTIAYQVRLSTGDYYEVPNHQTTITHSAVFATAGTARVTQIS